MSGNLKKSYLVLLNFRIPGPSFGIAQVNLTAIVSYTSCRNLILSAPDVLAADIDSYQRNVQDGNGELAQ